MAEGDDERDDNADRELADSDLADPGAAGLASGDMERWSETLAAIARTGLGFTESLYERERFEEVLHV
ncbi:MAG: NUDIX hydrolase N-terminal domain-containing protein, partial [Actinomycetota bacterium]|nr:NUDIX hydrolase N-terminal domain-containing protein [Actinomycetota bacterium]